MPEVGDVFQEVFFVEAKPPEANEIAAAQAEAVNIIHLEPISLQFLHSLSTVRHLSRSAYSAAHPTAKCSILATRLNAQTPSVAKAPNDLMKLAITIYSKAGYQLDVSESRPATQCCCHFLRASLTVCSPAMAWHNGSWQHFHRAH